MLGPAEADALRSEVSRHLRVPRRVGVGPHLQPPHLVDPAHERPEFLAHRRLDQIGPPLDHFPGGAVERDHPPRPHRDRPDRELPFFLVDHQLAAADHAAFAHPPGDHGGVARHAAAGGQNPLGGVHAADILRRGFRPHQDHLLAALRRLLGLLGREDDLADRRAGRRGQPLGDDVKLRLRIELRMEQLIELARVDPEDRGRFVDQPLIGHLHGNADRRGRRPLADAGLEHVERPLLDGELQIEHVPVMALQLAVDPLQLGIGLGDLLGHRLDRLGRPDAGHHILPLRVAEPFAEKAPLASGRVAREGDARTARVAHVAKDHRDDVDRGAPVVGNAVQPPVGDRPVAMP